MSYSIYRICDCGYSDEISLSKREAAFDLYDSKAIWEAICPNCNNAGQYSTSLNKPLLDEALLLEWAQDPDLYFIQQDEDLFLADEAHLELILKVLDETKMLKHKQDILMEALCVLIHDNDPTWFEDDTSPSEKEKRQQLAARVAKELSKRKELVLQSKGSIRSYVQTLAFPKIGLLPE